MWGLPHAPQSSVPTLRVSALLRGLPAAALSTDRGGFRVASRAGGVTQHAPCVLVETIGGYNWTNVLYLHPHGFRLHPKIP